MIENASETFKSFPIKFSPRYQKFLRNVLALSSTQIYLLDIWSMFDICGCINCYFCIVTHSFLGKPQKSKSNPFLFLDFLISREIEACNTFWKINLIDDEKFQNSL